MLSHTIYCILASNKLNTQIMVPSNDKASFFTGSFNFTGSLFRGFTATQTTVIDSMNWGVAGTGVGSVLSPKMTTAAGTTINVKFTAIAGTGSIVAFS